MSRVYTENKTNEIDNLRYMAKDIYGNFPFLVKMTMKVVELEYTSGNVGEHKLINPIFVTNVLVGKGASNIDDEVAISFGTNEYSDSFVQLGADGDVLVGNVVQYIRLSGNAQSEETITLTITGYELWYKPYVKLYCDQSIGIVNGSGYYNYGDEVQISALSVTGIESTMAFEKWSDGNTERVRNIILKDNVELTAIFKEHDIRGVINSGAPTFQFSTCDESGDNLITVPVQENGVWYYDFTKEQLDDEYLLSYNFRKSPQILELTEVCLGNLKPKRLHGTFLNCKSLYLIGLSKLDMSRCHAMNGTFSLGSSYSQNAVLDNNTIDEIENLDVSALRTDISYIFQGLGNERVLDLSRWNVETETAKVIRGFCSSTHFTKIILPPNLEKTKIKTNKSNNIDNMFYDNQLATDIVGIENLTLKGNVERVIPENPINCSAWFVRCKALQYVSMPKFEFDDNTDNISSFFNGSNNLQYIRLDSVKTNGIATKTSFFAGITASTKVYWHSSNNSELEAMFPNPTYVNLDDYAFYGWTAPNKTMVLGAYDDGVSGEDTQVVVTSDANGFFGVLNSELETYGGNLEFLLYDGTGDEFRPFRNDTDLKELYFQCGYNTDGNVDWSEFFKGCTSLKRVVFSGSNYGFTKMDSFFEGCSELVDVVFSTKVLSFYFDRGLSMDNMFKDCVSLKNLDLTNLYFYVNNDNYIDGNTNSINGMFNGCTSLEHINMPYIYKIGNAPIQTDVFNGLPDGAVVECKRSTYDWCEGSQYEDVEFVLSKDDVDGYTADEYDYEEEPNFFYFTINGNPVSIPFDESGHFVYNHYEKINQIDFHATNLISVVLGEGCADVTELNSYGTFQDCEYFTGVGTELPKGFGSKAVGTANNLFLNCVSLVDVSFVENLDLHNMTEANGMFDGCTSLVDVSKLASLDMSNCESINAFFRNCTSLVMTKIPFVVPSSVQYMNNFCWGCESIKSIDLRNSSFSGVLQANNMFQDCSQLKKVTMKNNQFKNATGLNAMFSGCAIQEITLPSGFGNSCISGFGGFLTNNPLKKATLNCTLPNATGLSGMFSGCNIEELYFCDGFGKKLTDNLNYTGANFSNIKVLSFGENNYQAVRSFGGFFSGVGNSTFKLRIPKSFGKNATSLGGFFSGLTCDELVIEETFDALTGFGIGGLCSGLNAKKIILPKNFAPNVTNVSGALTGTANVMDELIVPSGFAQNALSASAFFNGTCFNKITVECTFPNATDVSSAFSGCGSQEITLPKNFAPNATNLSNMFSGCGNIKKIVLPSGFCKKAEILQNMFTGCSSMESVELCDGFGTKAKNTNGMFTSCTNLKEVTFPKNFMSETGDLLQQNCFYTTGVFADCVNLKKVTYKKGFGEQFKNIQSMCHTTALEVVFECTFPNVTAFNNGAFGGQTRLQSITLPDGFLQNATNASSFLNNCTNLKKVVLGKNSFTNTTNLPSFFHNCYALEKVDIPEGFAPNAVSLEAFFYNCQNLKSLNIPEGFGQKATAFYAFLQYASSIVELTLPKGFAQNGTGGQDMFKGCSSLKKLNLPDNFFGNCSYSPTDMFRDCNFETLVIPKGFMKSIVGNSFSATFSTCGAENVIFNCDMNYMYNLFASNQKIKNVVFNGGFLNYLDMFGRNNLDMRNAFYRCHNLESVVFKGNGSFYNADLYQMCYQSENIVSFEMGGIKSEASTLSSTFWGCSNLEKINIGGISGYCSDYPDTFGSYYEDWEYHYDPETDEEEEVEVQVKSGCVKDGCVVTYARRKFTGFDTVYDFINWNNIQHDIKGHVANLFLSEIKIYNKSYNEYATVKLNSDQSFIYDFPMDKTPTDFTSMFEGVQIDSVDLTNLPFSSVQNYAKMFKDCNMLTSVVVLPNFGENGSNFSEMYRNCKSINTIKQRYGNLNNISYMFDGCDSLRKVDMSFCNAKNIANYNGFIPNRNNISVKVQKTIWNDDLVSTFNNVLWSYAVPSITGRTYSPNSYININIGGSNQYVPSDAEGNFGLLYDSERYGKLISLENFCNNQQNLSEINLENLDTENVTTVKWMFSDCKKLEGVTFPIGFGKNLTIAEGMFSGCSLLSTIDLSRLNTEKVVNMQNMFYHCSSLTSLDLSMLNTEKVSSIYQMFSGCTGLTSIVLPKNFCKNCTSFYYSFYGCSQLTEIDLRNCNFSKATEIGYMFYNCNALELIDMTGCDTRNINSYSSFVPNRDTLTIKYTDGLFNQNIINSFSSVNWVINFDSDIMGYVNDGSDTFSFLLNGDSEDNLVTVSVDGNGKWLYNIPDEVSLTSMKSMFSGCENLSKIYFNDSLDTSTVLDMSSMFENCTALNTISIPNNFGANVDNVRNMFSGCGIVNLRLPSGFAENATFVEGCFQSMTNLQYLTINGDFGKNAESFENLMMNTKHCINIQLGYVTATNCNNFTNAFKNCGSEYYQIAEEPTFLKITSMHVQDDDITTDMFTNYANYDYGEVRIDDAIFSQNVVEYWQDFGIDIY